MQARGQLAIDPKAPVGRREQRRLVVAVDDGKARRDVEQRRMQRVPFRFGRIGGWQRNVGALPFGILERDGALPARAEPSKTSREPLRVRHRGRLIRVRRRVSGMSIPASRPGRVDAALAVLAVLARGREHELEPIRPRLERQSELDGAIGIECERVHERHVAELDRLSPGLLPKRGAGEIEIPGSGQHCLRAHPAAASARVFAAESTIEKVAPLSGRSVRSSRVRGAVSVQAAMPTPCHWSQATETIGNGAVLASANWSRYVFAAPMRSLPERAGASGRAEQSSRNPGRRRRTPLGQNAHPGHFWRQHGKHVAGTWPGGEAAIGDPCRMHHARR